jgi:hypothetical protein
MGCVGCIAYGKLLNLVIWMLMDALLRVPSAGRMPDVRYDRSPHQHLSAATVENLSTDASVVVFTWLHRPD